MKKIPLGIAEVGNVLAQPVLQAQGGVMLQEGTALTESHLEMLRQRGVVLLTIEDPNESDDASSEPIMASPEVLKKIILEETRRFGSSREDPVMAEIFRCMVNRRAKGLHS